MHKTLLILAAGMASRYGGDKQVDAMGPHGEILLEYSIHDARRAGFDKVVFIIRRSMEDTFRRIIHGRIPNDMEVCFVFQEYDSLPNGFVPPAERTKPYGTAHAMLSARDAIHEPFAVINADDFYGREAYEAAAKHLDLLATCPGRAAMVAYLLKHTVSPNGYVTRGICKATRSNRLHQVKETYQILLCPDQIIRSMDGCPEGIELDPDSLASMNFWCFTPEIFDMAERELAAFLAAEDHATSLKCEFTLPDMVNLLMQNGSISVDVLYANSVWFGVTYREDKPHVMQELQKLHDAGIYPEKL